MRLAAFWASWLAALYCLARYACGGDEDELRLGRAGLVVWTVFSRHAWGTARGTTTGGWYSWAELGPLELRWHHREPDL